MTNTTLVFKERQGLIPMLYLHIISGYLVLVGTWRVACAVTPAPGITEIFRSKKHNWFINPILLHKNIILWFIGVYKKEKCEPDIASASIKPQELSSGLRWLLIGLLLQVVLQIIDS